MNQPFSHQPSPANPDDSSDPRVSSNRFDDLDITLPDDSLSNASIGDRAISSNDLPVHKPEDPKPADLIPHALSFSGKLARGYVTEVTVLQIEESVVGTSLDGSRFATFCNARDNDRGGLDGTVRVYNRAERDRDGNPKRVGDQGFRTKFGFVPTIIPLCGSEIALVIEDGNPLSRADIKENKRYCTVVSGLQLANTPDVDRSKLTFERTSTAYTVTPVLAPDEHALYLKGKRLSSWVEGWRGFDGAEVIERYSLLTPKWGPDSLYSRLFKREKDGDPRHISGMDLSADLTKLMCGAVGQVKLVPTDCKRKTSELSLGLPNDAQVSLLEVDRSGHSLVVAYRLKNDPVDRTIVAIYEPSAPGRTDSFTKRSEIALPERIRDVSLSPDGSKMVLSGLGASLYDIGSPGAPSLLGRCDLDRLLFTDPMTLFGHSGRYVIGIDLAKSP